MGIKPKTNSTIPEVRLYTAIASHNEYYYSMAGSSRTFATLYEETGISINNVTRFQNCLDWCYRDPRCALTSRDKDIIHWYYWDQLNTHDIAKLVNLSPSRVSQLIEKGLNKIHKGMIMYAHKDEYTNENLELKYTDLENRIVHALYRRRIYTLKDVSMRTRSEISYIRGIGKRHVDALEALLNKYEMGFKEE